MITPVELRALASQFVQMCVLAGSLETTIIAALRSAADRIEELEKALEQAKLKIADYEEAYGGAAVTRRSGENNSALEQAKREENEACAKVVNEYRFGGAFDLREICSTIRSRYPAQASGEKDETR